MWYYSPLPEGISRAMTTPPGEGGWVPLQGRSESKGGAGSLGTQGWCRPFGRPRRRQQLGVPRRYRPFGRPRKHRQLGEPRMQGALEGALEERAGWWKSFGRIFMGLGICIKAGWDQRRLRRWRKTGQDQHSLRRAGLGICGPVWAKQGNSSPLWAWFGNRSPLWAWFRKGSPL